MTLIFSIHYFLWFGALTSIFGYEGVYARHYTNASTMLFGYLKMFLPFATVIVTPIVCSLADRRRSHRAYFTSALLIAMLALCCLALLPVISTRQDLPSRKDTHSSSSESHKTNGELLLAPWIVYCVAILAYDLSIGVTTCLSDSFAVLQAEENGISFGRIIVWGTFGWATCAMVLGLLNQVTFLPRLLPGILFGVTLLTIDLITVSFWPNKRDFMLDRIPRDAAKILTSSSSVSHLDPSDYLPLNESAKVNMGQELSEADGTLRRHTESPVDIVRPRASRNDQQRSELEMSPDPASVSTILSNGNEKIDYDMSVLTNRSPLEPRTAKDTEHQIKQFTLQQTDSKQEAPLRPISLRIQLLLFFLIIKRRKTLIRYLIIFVLSGFFMALHWNYFFLYLEQIYLDKFELISALSMMGQGILGELPFFILSRKFIDYLGRSNTLSFSVITIGIRFLLYRFLLPNASMYYIFIADCFQGPNYGLFYVVMTEVGLEYSYCDDQTIDKLAEMGEVDRNDKRQVDALRLSLRSTVQSVAFACYEGLGVGLGSLTGGWLVASYGFDTLWLVMSGGAVSVGLVNLIIELFCREYDPEEELTERREFLEAQRQGILKKVASPRPLPIIGLPAGSLGPFKFQPPNDKRPTSQPPDAIVTQKAADLAGRLMDNGK